MFSKQPFIHKTAALCLTDQYHRILFVDLHFQNITSSKECQLVLNMYLKQFNLPWKFTFHDCDISEQAGSIFNGKIF